MRSKKRKKKKLPVTFPCTCGHSKKLHGWAGESIGDEWCNGYGARVGHGSLCECERYVPDNLKYLEQKYNQEKGKD